MSLLIKLQYAMFKIQYLNLCVLHFVFIVDNDSDKTIQSWEVE